MAAKKTRKKTPKKAANAVAKQTQAEFPPAEGAKLGECRVCGKECGPKASLCNTHRSLLARKRDRALFLAIKSTPEGKDLIAKVIKKGALTHLGL